MNQKKLEKKAQREKEKKEKTARLLALYQEIWAERPHKSEVSGTWLGKEIKTYFFHHILPKNSYKSLEFDRNNIILLTAEEHMLVEQKKHSFAKVNKLRDDLLEKLNNEKEEHMSIRVVIFDTSNRLSGNSEEESQEI